MPRCLNFDTCRFCGASTGARTRMIWVKCITLQRPQIRLTSQVKAFVFASEPLLSRLIFIS